MLVVAHERIADPSRPRRRLRRLAVFVCASLLTHALVLFGHDPAGATRSTFERPASGRALHATLVAPAHALDESATADGAEARRKKALREIAYDPRIERDASKARAHGPAQPAGANDLPLPATWHTADELDTRAEPLAPPQLDYPASLAGTGIAGRVRLQLFIDEHGIVQKARIAQSEPPDVFDEAAQQSWVAVRFSPATRHGVAVKSQKLLELDFLPF